MPCLDELLTPFLDSMTGAIPLHALMAALNGMRRTRVGYNSLQITSFSRGRRRVQSPVGLPPKNRNNLIERQNDGIFRPGLVAFHVALECCDSPVTHV
jgi:hypothetical protein